MAADGGSGGDRSQRQAAAAAAGPASTTCTSTSSRSVIRITRRSCRWAIDGLPPPIEAAERNGGQWRAAVAETGVDADFYIFRDRSSDPVLPWDIIDGGMKASFFQNGVRQGTPRRVDASAKAATGKHQAHSRAGLI